LWEFPLLEGADGSPEQRLEAAFGGGVRPARRLGHIGHALSGRILSVEVHRAEWTHPGRALPAALAHYREHAWVRPERWGDYPMPSYVHKIRAMEAVRRLGGTNC
jgi:hypothetical protein